jgi:hypothetical protein
VVKLSPVSTQFINPMDINRTIPTTKTPDLKSDFILSLCELIVGGKEGLQPVEKTIIDRCVRLVYRNTSQPSPSGCPFWRTCTICCASRTNRSPTPCHGAGNLCDRSLNVFNHRTNVDITTAWSATTSRSWQAAEKAGMHILQDQYGGVSRQPCRPPHHLFYRMSSICF